MPFVKLVKNKAYFKRFQTKFRRRREGKTDYYARKRLVNQDKNKYNTPKHRIVVRITNRDVIAQIVYSKIDGDIVRTAAYAHELPDYGLKVGLTNYASCYCVGLLLARRMLKILNLDGAYKGAEEVTAEMYEVEANDEGPRPFRCFLDIGLQRASTGARIFGVLKGAVDGGLDIPHNEKRFPGYDNESKEYDAEFHQSMIFATHVADYMEHLVEQDEDRYKEQFANYISNKVEADDIKEIIEATHAAIRANPERKKKTAKPDSKKAYNQVRLTKEQRYAAVQERKAAFLASQAE
jgi:large subunit ribosomal protein L5e